MQLKDKLKKEIESLSIDETLFLLDQINFIKKKQYKKKNIISIDEIHHLTSSSKSNWANDVINDRQVRG